MNDKKAKLKVIRRAAECAFPTGDTDRMLAEIELVLKPADFVPIVGRLCKPRAGFEPALGRLEIGQQVENLPPQKKNISMRSSN